MDIQDQVDLLMQGTEFGDDTLRQVMASELRQRLQEAQAEGRPLRVYCGYDPRTTDLHLGHTVTMRKLRQFQDLGHEVTFLIGSYTSLIGDPSDKDKLRPQLTPEQVVENGRTYAEQAFRVLDPTRTLVRYNAEWLAGLTFADLIRLASNFTIQQMLTRENFKLRWECGDAIFLHETFYALMQGYDAFSMRADVQVGGTDQLFNIVTASRKIMPALGARSNIAIIMGILPGTDGLVKMSKSLGNHIALNTTPEDMFGKIMKLPDVAMPSFFRLVTRWTPAQVAQTEQALASDELHPRDAKLRLAHEVVSTFFDEPAAQAAEADFVRRFSHHELPEQMASFHLPGAMTVLDVLVKAGLVASRSEGRRLIAQNGVRLDGETLQDGGALFPHPGVLQAGKLRFVRVA